MSLPAILRTTIPKAYKNGAAGPQTVELDTTRLGVVFEDAVVPIGGADSGTSLLRAQGNGDTSFAGYFEVNNFDQSGQSVRAKSLIIYDVVESGATAGVTRSILRVVPNAYDNHLVGANVELVDLDFDLSHTLTFGAGALALQRAAVITPPTYAASVAKVITDAATLDVEGSPRAGANMTLTRKFSLLVRDDSTAGGHGNPMIGLRNTAAGSVQTQRIETGTGSGLWSYNIAGPAGTRDSAGSAWQLSMEGSLNGGSDQLVLLHVLDTGVGTNVFKITALGTTITQDKVLAGGGGLARALTIVPRGHVNLTASTECSAVLVDSPSVEVQFAAGALAIQRTVAILPSTYAFVAASTIAEAATLAVSGPPVAGTNATITSKYTFWTQAGDIRVTGGKVIVDAGTAAQPALKYSDTSGGAVGIYFTTSPLQIHFSVGGGGVFAMGGSQLLATSNGSAIVPIYTRVAADHGMYFSATTLNFAVANVQRLNLSNDAEAASVTSLYLSVNGVMKRVTVSALVGDAGNHLLQIAD